MVPGPLRTGSRIQSPPFSTAPLPAAWQEPSTPHLHLRKEEAAMSAPWGLGSPSLRQRLPSTWGGAVALTGPHAHPTLSTLAALSWAGTGKAIPYKQPPSTTPFGTRLGPRVPQYPVMEDLPPSPTQKSPEPQAKPHLSLLVSGHSTLGWTTRLTMFIPRPVLPRGPLMLHGAPEGPVSAVFHCQLNRHPDTCCHCVCHPRLPDSISSDTCETPRSAVVSAMHPFCT